MNVPANPRAFDPATATLAVGPQAVVIGSGFGGLAAALRMRAKGYRVTLIERGSRLGGWSKGIGADWKVISPCAAGVLSCS